MTLAFIEICGGATLDCMSAPSGEAIKIERSLAAGQSVLVVVENAAECDFVAGFFAQGL